MVYISLGYVQSMSDGVGLSWENWRDGPGNTETNCAFLYTTSGQLTIKKNSYTSLHVLLRALQTQNILFRLQRSIQGSTDLECTVQTTEIYTGIYRPRIYCLDYRDLYRALKTQNVLFRLQIYIETTLDQKKYRTLQA